MGPGTASTTTSAVLPAAVNLSRYPDRSTLYDLFSGRTDCVNTPQALHPIGDFNVIEFKVDSAPRQIDRMYAFYPAYGHLEFTPALELYSLVRTGDPARFSAVMQLPNTFGREYLAQILDQLIPPSSLVSFVEQGLGGKGKPEISMQFDHFVHGVRLDLVHGFPLWIPFRALGDEGWGSIRMAKVYDWYVDAMERFLDGAAAKLDHYPHDIRSMSIASSDFILRAEFCASSPEPRLPLVSIFCRRTGMPEKLASALLESGGLVPRGCDVAAAVPALTKVLCGLPIR